MIKGKILKRKNNEKVQNQLATWKQPGGTALKFSLQRKENVHKNS